MKLQLVALVVLSLICAATASAPPPRPKPLETDYYPLKVGNKWTYRNIDVKSTDEKKDPLAKQDDNKRRYPKVVVEVEREAIFDRVSTELAKDKKEKEVTEQFMGYLLKSTSSGKTTFDHVVVLREGIHRISVGGTPSTPPLPIKPPLKFFQFQVKAGDSWECNSETRDGKIKGTFTVRNETIKVPAGEFYAFVISLRDGPAVNTRVEIDYWFAQGVGLVKQRVKAKNGESVLELERFDPAK